MKKEYVIDQIRGQHIRDYSDQSQDRVIICSNTGYWAANGCGYTTSQMAGVYTRDDAYKRAGHCGPEKGCCFYDVPADHVPTLQAEVERLRAYREAEAVRCAKADCYDRICQHLGVTSNVIGTIAERERRIKEQAVAEWLDSMVSAALAAHPCKKEGGGNGKTDNI